MARFIWNTVCITFGIKPPSSVANLLGSWLNGYPLEMRKQILAVHQLCVEPFG
jgi:hypothetical protein